MISMLHPQHCDSCPMLPHAFPRVSLSPRLILQPVCLFLCLVIQVGRRCQRALVPLSCPRSWLLRRSDHQSRRPKSRVHVRYSVPARHTLVLKCPEMGSQSRRRNRCPRLEGLRNWRPKRSLECLAGSLGAGGYWVGPV